MIHENFCKKILANSIKTFSIIQIQMLLIFQGVKGQEAHNIHAKYFVAASNEVQLLAKS